METIKVNSPKVSTALFARYFFLDDEERAAFTLNEHQYLITETQRQEFSVTTTQDRQTFSLYLNHPGKISLHALLFALQFLEIFLSNFG